MLQKKAFQKFKCRPYGWKDQTKKIPVPDMWALALNQKGDLMNRQQKRAALRNVAKVATKVRKGTADINEVKALQQSIQRLQEVGVLSKRKLPIHKRIGNFFRKILGGQVGYIRS